MGRDERPSDRYRVAYARVLRWVTDPVGVVQKITDRLFGVPKPRTF